jgi:hypothetical protein
MDFPHHLDPTKGADQQQGPTRGMTCAAYAIIAVVCVALYGHCLWFGFTNNDDNSMISEKVAYLRDLGNLPRAFVTDAWHTRKEIELYRPLQSATYFIDAQTGDNIALASHRNNLIIHILVCWVVFSLLVLLTLPPAYALVGALIYACHYLFLHTVIWIPGRGDLLLALFAFLSLVLLSKYQHRNRAVFLVLHLLCYVLALLAKETAIMLPLLFLGYLRLFARTSTDRKALVMLVSGYVAVSGLYSVIRSSFVAQTEGSFALANLITNLPVMAETVAKFFVPVNFSTMPAFDGVATFTGVVIMLLSSGYGIYHRQYRDKLTMFGALWFVLLMLPAMLYRPAVVSLDYAYLDHRSYAICFGLLLIGLRMVQQLQLHKTTLYLACAVLLIYLAGVNYHFSAAYQTPSAYAEQAIRTNPRSVIAYFIRGCERLKQKDPDGALADFSTVIRLHPNEKVSLYNRALLYMNKRQVDQALTDINRVLAIDPEYSANAYYVRGDIMIVKGQYDFACADFQRAAALDPLYSDRYRACTPK